MIYAIFNNSTPKRTANALYLKLIININRGYDITCTLNPGQRESRQQVHVYADSSVLLVHNTVQTDVKSPKQAVKCTDKTQI